MNLGPMNIRHLMQHDELEKKSQKIIIEYVIEKWKILTGHHGLLAKIEFVAPSRGRHVLFAAFPPPSMAPVAAGEESK